jgi:hypothetical protein
MFTNKDGISKRKLNRLILILFSILMKVNSQCFKSNPQRKSDCWSLHSVNQACCYTEKYRLNDLTTKPSSITCESVLSINAITGVTYDSDGSTIFSDCGNYANPTELKCGPKIPINSQECLRFSTTESLCCFSSAIPDGKTSLNPTCFMSGNLNPVSYRNKIGDKNYLVICQTQASHTNTFNYLLILILLFIL